METLIVHVSQNSMNKGVVGQEAASQLKKIVDKSEPKFNTHLVMCKIRPVKKVSMEEKHAAKRYLNSMIIRKL